jgi:prepilin-type N-terminal cleavage/methylation domain-containing protein
MLYKLPIVKRLASRAGFSLIEVLVAIGIFSFAMLGLAVGAITITRANSTSQFHTVGTNVAQDVLEQLKAQPFAAVNTCTVPPCIADQTFQGVTFTSIWTVTPNPTATFKQIDVTVTWTDTAARTLTVSSGIAL